MSTRKPAADVLHRHARRFVEAEAGSNRHCVTPHEGRLAASVPPPRYLIVKYAGVLEVRGCAGARRSR